MNKWCKKKDKNHNLIRDEFIKNGFKWKETHIYPGLGFDGIAKKDDKILFVEIKNGSGLTDSEKVARDFFGDNFLVIKKLEEVPK